MMGDVRLSNIPIRLNYPHLLERFDEWSKVSEELEKKETISTFYYLNKTI